MDLLYRSGLLLFAGLVFFLLAGLVATWAPDKSVDQLRARWAQPPSQIVEIDGLLVHLRDEGPRDDPSPILLLHGTSDSLHTWDGWASVLRQQRRVIRFDLPGFGLTGPDRDNDYTIGRYVRFVGAVLDHLGVRQCVLAGNSLGGLIAWTAAHAMPQRVRQLILVDAAGYPSARGDAPLAFALASNQGARLLLEHVLPRGLVQSALRDMVGDAAKVTPDMVDRYYDMALRTGNRRALGHRMEAGLVGDWAVLKQLKLPTLVIWGGRDRLIPLESGRQFARDIEHARLVVFDELGHLPHMEEPTKTVLEVQRFVGWKLAD